MHNKNKKLIFLTGGGTAGSVTPLLAIAEELSEYDYLLLGTKSGPEETMAKNAKIKFQPILNGKLRRYFSWNNFVDIFKIFGAFSQSTWLVLKYKPALIISAGSFVSVPVVWAGWLFGIKILIHQQDARAGLANKLMALFADIITVTFEKSLKDYKKAIWVGNPTIIKNYELPVSFSASRGGIITDENNVLPSVLVVGGGTGSQAINALVYKSIDELTRFCRIIHITGKNKKINFQSSVKNYQQFEFLDAEKMAKALYQSNVVVSRCGMGLLTELSYFGKSAILIPIPDSHQEDNAKVFADKKAAIILNQKDLTSEKLIKEIKNLLDNKSFCDQLSKNIQTVIKTDANKKIGDIINKLLS